MLLTVLTDVETFACLLIYTRLRLIEESDLVAMTTDY